MNAKIILQRLATEEDVRNNYTTFTACGGYRAAANVFTESADVTGHIEDGADYVAFRRIDETRAPGNYESFRGTRRRCRGR